MKYILNLFLFLFLLPVSSIAQDQGAEDMMTADEFIEEEIKDIEWQTTKFYDIGEINQNHPATVEYKFKNLSDEPIVITQVKSSCSCSVSEYTKAPILKGEEGIIKATYDAKAEGTFFKTFMLLTSRSTTPNVLVISGNVIKE